MLSFSSLLTCKNIGARSLGSAPAFDVPLRSAILWPKSNQHISTKVRNPSIDR